MSFQENVLKGIGFLDGHLNERESPWKRKKTEGDLPLRVICITRETSGYEAARNRQGGKHSSNLETHKISHKTNIGINLII